MVNTALVFVQIAHYTKGITNFVCFNLKFNGCFFKTTALTTPDVKFGDYGAAPSRISKQGASVIGYISSHRTADGVGGRFTAAIQLSLPKGPLSRREQPRSDNNND